MSPSEKFRKNLAPKISSVRSRAARFNPTYEDGAALLILLMPVWLIVGPLAAEIANAGNILLFLFHCWRTRDMTWLRAPWVRVGLLIWAFLYVSAAFALSDKPMAFERAATWGRFLFLPIAILFWHRERSWWRGALESLLVCVLVFVVLDTLAQYLLGVSLSGHIRPLYPAGRLNGPFARLVVGIYLAKLFWPTLAPLLRWAHRPAGRDGTLMRRRAVVPLLFIGGVALTILLSGERMAFLLTGLGLGLFFTAATGFRRPLLLCGLPVVAVAALLVATQPGLRARTLDAGHILTHFDETGYGVIFHNALVAWRQAPVIGVGPRNFLALCNERGVAVGYRDALPESAATFDCARHPHNPYLEWLADTGVIGLGLFLTLVTLWVRQAVRAVWQQRHAAPHIYLPRLALAIGLLPFLWPLQGNMSLFINWNGMLFWWSVGVILAGLQQTKPLHAKNGTTPADMIAA